MILLDAYDESDYDTINRFLRELGYNPAKDMEHINEDAS